MHSRCSKFEGVCQGRKVFAPSFLRRPPLRRLFDVPLATLSFSGARASLRVTSLQSVSSLPAFAPTLVVYWDFDTVLDPSLVSHRFLHSFFFSLFDTSFLHYVSSSPNREWEHVIAPCVQRARWPSDQVARRSILSSHSNIPAIVIREGRVPFRSPWFQCSYVVCRI